MSDKFFRTLVRITGVTDNYVALVIPAWDYKTPVIVSRNILSSKIKAGAGNRFYCMVNIGAENKSELKFRPPFESATELDAEL